MNRRGFFGSILGAGAAVVVAPAWWSRVLDWFKPKVRWLVGRGYFSERGMQVAWFEIDAPDHPQGDIVVLVGDEAVRGWEA